MKESLLGLSMFVAFGICVAAAARAGNFTISDPQVNQKVDWQATIYGAGAYTDSPNTEWKFEIKDDVTSQVLNFGEGTTPGMPDDGDWMKILEPPASTGYWVNGDAYLSANIYKKVNGSWVYCSGNLFLNHRPPDP